MDYMLRIPQRLMHPKPRLEASTSYGILCFAALAPPSPHSNEVSGLHMPHSSGREPLSKAPGLAHLIPT